MYGLVGFSGGKLIYPEARGFLLWSPYITHCVPNLTAGSLAFFHVTGTSGIKAVKLLNFVWHTREEGLQEKYLDALIGCLSVQPWYGVWEQAPPPPPICNPCTCTRSPRKRVTDLRDGGNGEWLIRGGKSQLQSMSFSSWLVGIFINIFSHIF